MQRLGGAEAQPPRYRSPRGCSASARCARRRPPAAAGPRFRSRDSGADRLALDGLVGRQVVARDEAAMRSPCSRRRMSPSGPPYSAASPCCAISAASRHIRLHHALAGLQRRAAGQIDRRDRLVLAASPRRRRRRIRADRASPEAARGVPDRGLHHVGERQGAEARQRLAPGLQRAGHGDRVRADAGFRRRRHRTRHAPNRVSSV